MKRTLYKTRVEADAMNAFVKLMRAAEVVTSATHRHLVEANLTISQFGVLEALYHLGSLCQRDVAKKILKSTANITTVVDNLESRGLVERIRSSDDRRYVALHLTEEGTQLIAQIFPVHVQGIVQSLSALTREEQEELARLCKKLGLAQGE
jgi:MarR family 2-MHQ and catechol resistance regulon transcriptional repressor